MQQLRDLLVGLPQGGALREAVYLIGSMLAGGVIGYWVRVLYRRFATTLSNRDSFSSTFPLLTVATILVISVIKSSLALSLGLVGALSIVRFRAAIKEPEEIVYLFFCISIGIALGARFIPLALAGMVVFSLFVVLGHHLRGRAGAQQLLLTISGAQPEIFGGDLTRFSRSVAELVGRHDVQRLDVEDGQVRYRIAVFPESPDAVGAMVAGLQARLPMCQISYVNLKSLL
ncbi:MAG: hypothetical protein A2W00_10740 [Candidatus Eisenbacteria bacterium RBG_16_71_46]|nr:MAG: hypothetical protein A2W00_10740 [Candidatus Eisenbacteria bacterium RBG_16_71_46]